MINWDKSAELNGMSIDKLKAWFDKYPSSHKRIIRICDVCFDERNIGFAGHSDLCNNCSINTPEVIEANRLRGIKRFSDSNQRDAARLKAIEQFSDPAQREAARLRAIKQFSDQSARDEMSRIMVQYHINNPEARESARLKTIEQFSDPAAREAARLKSLELWADPEFRNKLSGENHYLYGKHLSEDRRDNQSKVMVNHYKDPKEREKRSAGLKKYLNEHPEVCIKRGEHFKELWDDSEFRDMMDEIIKLRYEDPLVHEKLRVSQLLRWERQRWNDQIYPFINGELIIDFVSSPIDGYGIPSDKYDEWRRAIYARDNYVCQICGANNCEVHAHHIIPQRVNRDLILDINNGITLCKDCHELTYGKEEIYAEALFEKLEE